MLKTSLVGRPVSIRMTSPSSADTVYLSLLYWTVWSSSFSSLLAKSSSASRIISCVVRRSASPSDGCLFFRTVSIICDRDCPFDSVFFFFSLAVVPFVQQIIFLIAVKNFWTIGFLLVSKMAATHS